MTQGSVVDPTLFIIYIKDLESDIKKYADSQRTSDVFDKIQLDFNILID